MVCIFYINLPHLFFVKVHSATRRAKLVNMLCQKRSSAVKMKENIQDETENELPESFELPTSKPNHSKWVSWKRQKIAFAFGDTVLKHRLTFSSADFA